MFLLLNGVGEWEVWKRLCTVPPSVPTGTEQNKWAVAKQSQFLIKDNIDLDGGTRMKTTETNAVLTGLVQYPGTKCHSLPLQKRQTLARHEFLGKVSWFPLISYLKGNWKVRVQPNQPITLLQPHQPHQPFPHCRPARQPIVSHGVYTLQIGNIKHAMKS